MKNFFDQLGKIGEILAPIPGSPSPFFFAIQHHNNAEIQTTMLNCGDVDILRLSENGYFPIHCACQFNNLFAVDLMMGRGVHIDFPDVHGNTPLHYAAKYGHPDLCKVLIERGSFAGVKNNLGQTAYDVSGTPVVRQYLQPQPFASNTPGDIYCQTQGHMMGNSNYPMPIQPALYGEQPPVYTKPAEQPTSYPQEQQMHAPAVQISPAPMVQGLVINQSNSISTPASPLIMGNNQMKNVHANLFGRNEILLPKTDPSSNSGPPSFNTQPVRQGVPGNQNFPASISPHLPSPNKPQVTAPLQLPSQSPHQLPLPQVVHPSPQRQIHVVPAQQIHQVPAQQIHQVPAQQIHQAPAQKPHNQLPNNFNSAYYPGSSPPVSQPPPIVPQSYKPVAVNGSLSRIIQPDGFHTSASDPELQKKYGHTRNIVDIAPPPIFNVNTGMNAPPTYGAYNTQPPAANYHENQNFMPPQAYGNHIGNGPKH